ncbi:MAG: hypothetical protein VBE63_30505 [Lamprobacter sp.]|uniref:hypothetical protein n=1 Tax=Lamprobacter sp. TaxID=3100796 RepID=UPI002B25F533|nr:hypothetical protein [Lamprobacter sp.]MEA3644223.1 hypothetical protein [Lamprobacter sp.]
MIPIQEIDVYSNKGIKISAHLVVPSVGNNLSAAEVLVYDPVCNILYSDYQKLGQYEDPQTAFKSIIDFSKKYIEQSGGSVIRINNPNNTEFVDAQLQQKLVSALIPGLTVEVNG